MLMIFAAAAVAVVPVFGDSYITTLVFTTLIAFILAQSWDWIAGEMGYINLGHCCFYGIGAYAFAIALVASYPMALALVFGVAVTMIAATLLSFPLFRLHGDYFAFGTLALLPLGEILAYNLTPITNGGDGIVLPPENVLTVAYWCAFAVCVIAVAVTFWLNRNRFGYALKSVRNDEEVAEVMGIRIFPLKLKVLVLSGAFAALAGGIQAWQMSYIDPGTVFGLNVALIPVAMALLGGSGLLWGPLVGVILLAGLQQSMLANMQDLQATVYGAVILLIGRFMPGGILRAAWLRGFGWLKALTQEHHERITGPQRERASTELPLVPHAIDRSKVLLQFQGLTKAFGGNIAVDGVSLKIMQGEIVGLIGANGSGKTTLFNCISKVYEPTDGDLLLDGVSLKGLRRDQVSRLRVGRTYQIPRPFGDLTVQENIAVALMFRDRRMSPHRALEQARDFATYADLDEHLTARADSLSLQQRKALEFVRALALRPRLLLVDEVASGLTPAEVKRFVQQIRAARDRYGITIIWVEHIFSALAQVVDRVVVLDHGRLIAADTLQEVMKNEQVLKTYLGSAAVEVAHA